MLNTDEYLALVHENSKQTLAPRIRGCGSAFPETLYTQDEVATLFGITNPTVLKLMAAGHVRTRHLLLPGIDKEMGRILYESPEDLHRKFEEASLDIGVRASLSALCDANLNINDVDVFIAITSTGFAVPGLSSLISKKLKMRSGIHRLDLVGMGCNAGMSGLFAAAQMSRADPRLNILMLCCEISSASYVKDDTVRTGIVNSLFGDGAAAIVIGGSKREAKNAAKDAVTSASRQRKIYPSLKILDFESFTLADQSDAMKFTYNSQQHKWSFLLSKDIPFVIGRNIHIPVEILLNRNKIPKDSVNHWVLHTGGGAVIDGAKKSLKLEEHQVRHTRSVLRDFGNLSSGSFLVSLERLLEEESVESGALAVLIAMGPGATIEACLAQFD